MSVTTLDARGKAVYSQLTDKVSTLYPVRNIFRDMSGEMDGTRNQSIDIITRAAITIEQASNSSGVAQTMTIQSNTPTANNLVVDQHYGSVVGVGKMSKTFDMGGAWAGQMAEQILIELGDYIDQDHIDELIRVGAYSSTAAYTSNVAGDALSNTDIEQAIAILASMRGARRADFAWLFNPYGIGNIRNLSAFIPHENAVAGVLGTPTVGSLHGIPVIESQAVPTSLAVATTACTIATNVCTATVAAGHGIVPGMVISLAGTTVTGSDKTVSSVTDTTIVFPLTGADGAMADGVGTITCSRAMNMLVNRRWIFSAVQQVPDIEIVTSETKFQDILKFDAIWGLKVLAASAVLLPSPASSVS